MSQACYIRTRLHKIPTFLPRTLKVCHGLLDVRLDWRACHCGARQVEDPKPAKRNCVAHGLASPPERRSLGLVGSQPPYASVREYSKDTRRPRVAVILRPRRDFLAPTLASSPTLFDRCDRRQSLRAVASLGSTIIAFGICIVVVLDNRVRGAWFEDDDRLFVAALAPYLARALREESS